MAHIAWDKETGIGTVIRTLEETKRLAKTRSLGLLKWCRDYACSNTTKAYWQRRLDQARCEMNGNPSRCDSIKAFCRGVLKKMGASDGI